MNRRGFFGALFGLAVGLYLPIVAKAKKYYRTHPQEEAILRKRRLLAMLRDKGVVKSSNIELTWKVRFKREGSGVRSS